MKKTTILSTVLCLALIASGCNGNKEAPSSESKASETSAAASEETTEETTEATTEETTEETEASKAEGTSYDIKVEDVKTTLSDDYGEYKRILPKLIVNGEEATEINNEIASYMDENFPLDDRYGDNLDGFETNYNWGVKDNTLSFIINANYISEDYGDHVIFNYDLDTLKPIEDSEVTSRFGLTDEELFSKTAEIYTEYFSDREYIDVEKSIEIIGYDKITPFVTPDGNTGVAGAIVAGEGSQFAGSESLCCFDLTTMDSVSLSW